MKRTALLTMLIAALFLPAARARAQFLIVDCSGANPSAFPTINSALPYAGPGAFIAVTGTCNEDVYLFGFNNLTLGAFYGQTATINGELTVYDSRLVYLYGLNITNTNGDGIDVFSSYSVTLDTCTSSGNAGAGLIAEQSSDVTVNGIGTFTNNGWVGINLSSNAFVNISSYAGTTEISGNQVSAIFMTQANFQTFGNTHIANSGSAVAIDMRGGGKAQFGSPLGPNVIENNANGGAFLQENAEISFWSPAQTGDMNTIQNNGPFGVKAGFGSQVTLAGAVVSGHTGPGVDIFGHSQLYGTSQIPGIGTTQILNNGTAGGSLGAGVRVDGNSEVLLRGVNISSTNGPAILALVNSSADFAGMTFSGNIGVIACDSTSTMVTDLAASASNPGSGLHCTVSNTAPIRSVAETPPPAPNIAPLKALHQKYIQRSSARK
jgi:parallel beta helix pectate lyase-like protein